MNEIKSFNDVPHGFHLCLNGECPWKETCLRQIAMRLLPDGEEFVFMVNPNLTAHPEAKADGTPACRFYKPLRTVTYARGFKAIEKQMTVQQFGRFRSYMLSNFGRNPFYERRKGNLALPPEEQDFIKHVMSAVGFVADNPFDTTEERVDWGM